MEPLKSKKNKSTKKNIQTTQQNNYNIDTFIKLPDLRASFFILEENSNYSMLIRMEEGRYNGVIIKVSNFNFPDKDDSTKLEFSYQVGFNPYNKELPIKHITTVVSKIMNKILKLAMGKAILKNI